MQLIGNTTQHSQNKISKFEAFFAQHRFCIALPPFVHSFGMVAGGSKRKGGGSDSEAKQPKLTIPALAQNKLNENFKLLSSTECDILLDPITQQTLRQRLVADLTKKSKGDRGGKLKHTQTTSH